MATLQPCAICPPTRSDATNARRTKTNKEKRHGTSCRTRPARHRRRAQHHAAAGARQEAGAAAQVRRHPDRRRRRPSLRKRVHGRHPPLPGERRHPPARDRQPGQGTRQPRSQHGGRLPGHGRPHHALSAALVREDREGRQDARRAARPSLDGRDERRLFLPVPDADARDRPASGIRDGGRVVLGLQSLAHGKGAAGIGRAFLFDAEPAAVGARRGDAPDRNLRRPQGRHRAS